MTTAEKPAAAPGLRERKRQQRRQRILEVSRALFERDGFDTTSIEGIAAAVDVSPGTIYKFFPTKIDILTALLQEDLQTRREGMPDIEPEAGQAPEEAVLQLLEQDIRALELLSRSDVALITAHAIATGSSTQTGRIYAAIDDYGRKRIHSLLCKLQNSGALRPSVDTKLLSKLIFSLANGEYYAWLIGQPGSMEEAMSRLRHYLAIIFAGAEARRNA